MIHLLFINCYLLFTDYNTGTFTSSSSSTETNNFEIDIEDTLRTNLLTTYRNEIIPIIDNKPITLNLGLVLKSFHNINHVDGIITSNIWLIYEWEDKLLSWNTTNYNISSLSFYTSVDYENRIWIPDIYLLNSGEKPMSNLDMSRLKVYNNGIIRWIRPGLILSRCKFDLKYFPYDEQICKFEFGSWIYNNQKLNISYSEHAIDLSNYQKSDSWDIINYKTYLTERKYDCCLETYNTINFEFKIRRKPGYYDLNIVIPTFLTTSLMVCSLLIPWNSGERISFTTTVMLSIIVFLLIISENLPKTNNKPLLSIILIGLILFSFVVIFITVIIQNFHTYSKNKGKISLLILNYLNKIGLYKKEKLSNKYVERLGLKRSISYNNIVNEDELLKNANKKCVNIFELSFSLLFLLIFIIYYIVIYSLIPNY